MTAFFSWTQYLAEGGPARFRRGNLQKLVGTMYGIPADTVSQGADEAFLHRCLLHELSPDDFLRLAGIERSLPQYAIEDNDDYRERLVDAWDVWPTAGSDTGIVQQLHTQGLSASYIVFNLAPGGEVYDGTTQVGARHIKQYPSHWDWWAEFAVLIDLPSGSIGNGAKPWQDVLGEYSGTGSILFSQAQLDTVRQVVDLFKPVGWLCREIIVVDSTDDLYWGSPAYAWGSFTWGTGSAGIIVEQFPHRNITGREWQRINT